MKHVISVSYGELTLKGKNRSRFEDQAIHKVRRSLRNFHVERIYKEQGKFYIEAAKDDIPAMIEEMKHVFGIVSMSPAVRVEKDIAACEEACRSVVAGKTGTFKVQAHRSDKSFPMKSPEINAHFGGVVLKANPDLKVDVKNPDFILYIEVKKYIYIYTERIEGTGGLPSGSSGRGLLLLSGGIDSPVAGYLMAGRGMELGCLHFHSYPFTPIRGEEKAKDLARVVAEYTGPMSFYSVNLLPIQKSIMQNAREREMTILSRRFMMRIGERIARDHSYQALITGESLGQVASQTIESVDVINRSVEMPILRPLIGMDKRYITNVAERIGSYPISTLPFEDCCTVFLPKRPVTKPRLQDILESESKLDIDGLVSDAIDKMELTRIKPDGAEG